MHFLFQVFQLIEEFLALDIEIVSAFGGGGSVFGAFEKLSLEFGFQFLDDAAQALWGDEEGVGGFVDAAFFVDETEAAEVSGVQMVFLLLFCVDLNMFSIRRGRGDWQGWGMYGGEWCYK